MKNAAIVIVILAVLGGGAILAANSSSSDKTNNQSNKPASQNSANAQNQNSSAAAATGNDQSTGATITYGGNGFSPSTLTVKSGTTVTVKNTAGPLEFASDPHPAHTDDPELNAGVVKTGGSVTFTVTKTGSHGYHNHLNPSDTGTIVVQ
jgi:plastocyanin